MCVAVHSLQAGHHFEAAVKTAHSELQQHPTDWPLLLQLVELLHKLGRHGAALSASASLEAESFLAGSDAELLTKLRILLVKAACLVASANQRKPTADGDPEQPCRGASDG